MQYALVEGKKVEAFSGGRGNCPICNSETIAKCGPRVIHHWAHHKNRDCDPWWENETPWHREWKNRFPPDWREVSHTANDGEIHRADIKTSNGIVIEIQHSSMSDQERLAREEFYQNMLWIIDGSTFKRNFDLCHPLPDPDSELAKDLVWAKAKRHMNGSNSGLFFRISEAIKDDPTITKETLKGGWVHSIREIEEELLENYSGHHQYAWMRPRKTWLDANCPVYIDFGDQFLARVEQYDSSGLKCVRLIAKEEFLESVKRANDTSAVLV